MRRILSIVLCLMLSLTAAFSASTQSTDFWLTFMRNLRVGQCSIIASSASDATVTVTNPVTLWSTSFTVSAGQTAICELPREQCYLDNGGSVESKGIHITSTAPIDLFASNYADYTYDASLVLPTSALGTNYIIQTYEDKSETAELAIVATMPNTSVTITPHAQTQDGHVPNVSYSVTLQPGEAYQVFSTDGGNDFSGTYIYADKPIAVFAGHACAKVPDTNSWCDHLVEQQYPTSLWGKQFAVTKTIGQQSNRIMITAKENNTLVQLNGTQVAVLQALQTYSFRLTDNSAFIQTSEPVACFLYIEGARSNNLFGDPSSVTITPIEQRTRDLTFSTFQTNTDTHYLNVVTTAVGAASMKLDGHSVASSFTPLTGNSAWQFAQLSVSQGTHTLRTANDGFVGYIYGMGYCESYAYPMGSSLYTLNIDETGSEMGGFPYIDMTFTDAQCYRKPILFTAYTNINYTALTWDFGDGQTASGLTPSHTYAAPGAYTVTLTVTRNENNASITRTVLVSDTYRDTIHAEICAGETYLYEGTPYTESGVYTVKQSSLADCDSLVMLDLIVHPTYHSVEYASFPRGASYGWHDRRFRSAGTYRDTIPSIHGCDSTFELHLTTTDPTEIMYDTICYRPTYYFHGFNYPLPSVEGYEDREFINYTLAYADKYNCKTYRIHLAIIPREAGDYVVYDTISSGQSYTWFGQTYTSSGTYTKTIGDNACLQHCTLHLYVSPFPIEKTDSTFCLTDTIFWRGQVFTQPGIYYDTLFSVFGIESIHRLQLIDNRSFSNISVQDVPFYDFHGHMLFQSGIYHDTLVNAAGCDSVCTLNLTIQPLTGDTSASFCNGTPFVWHGTPYATGGDYPYTYTSKVAPYCDSIVTLHLTQLEPTDSVEIVTLCAGGAHTWHGQTYTSSTSVTETIPNAAGCDSVCTLNLTILPALTGDTSATFCSGTPFIWNGISYSIGGDYPYTYTSKVAPYCDSIVTLHLTQLEHSDSIEVVAICYGETHTWHGQIFSESTTKSETIPNAVGCDSVCTLQLTVVPKLTGDTSATFCNGTPFMWNGTPYATGGDYPYTYTSKVSPYCDSIVTLHLTQLEPTDSVENVTLCAGGAHTWHGQTYTSSTNETEIIPNSVGCDSVCTLNLTILPVFTGATKATITEGATYTWNGQPYSAEGDYTQTLTTDAGCDSVVTLHLKVNPLIYEIITHSQCADDPFVEFELQADDGLIHQLQFAFSQKALNQHFRDTTVIITTSLIQIPNSARAGIYDVAISPLFDQQLLDTRNYQFTLLYPSSVLDQHWDDFIGVLTNSYNGGYDFIGFQWYKNGSPITGENHSYLYQPLEMGSPYSAMLEESDGTKLMTCEIIATPQTEISLYPTLLQPRQIIRLHSSEDVTIWLYDSLGKLIYTNSFERGDSQFAAPQDHGIYIVKIQQTGEKGKSETKKLIVR